MAFSIPSLSETRDFLLAVGKALFPDRNYGNVRSYHSKRATFLAAAVSQLHAHITSVQDDVIPITAGDGAPINRWGEIVGVERKSATPSRKAAALRVYGTAATPVDIDEELVHQSSGLVYQIAANAIVGAAGFVDCDIVSVSTGSATKLAKGQTLQFSATPAGLRGTALLVLDIDEDGFDDEAFGEYRTRVLAQFSEPTAGGTAADFVEWILELEGISRAYAYPNRAGLGTVDVVGLHTGSGAARELDAGDRAAMIARIRERAPAQIAGTGGSIRDLDVVVQAENVEIVLEPNGAAAYAFDWSGGPLAVLSWEAGGVARKLRFTTDRPATMKAGHRVSLKGVATIQNGEELTIEALSGTDAVILEDAPDVAPAATDIVYSGGPLVTPIRDAIVAHMNGETVYAGRNRVPRTQGQLDELGESVVNLEVLAEGIGPANPGGIYGEWNGDLLRSLLYQIAMYKAGVRNLTIASPVVDVVSEDFAFPNDAQIGLIAPGAVLIRGAT